MQTLCTVRFKSTLKENHITKESNGFHNYSTDTVIDCLLCSRKRHRGVKLGTFNNDTH